MVPNAPLNVLTRNVGNGNLEVQWDPVINTILYSEDFSNVVWTPTAATITTDVTTDPAGGATADKIVDAAANSYHMVAQTPAATFIAGKKYTFSAFFKAAEGHFPNLAFLDEFGILQAGAIFNVQNGTIPIDFSNGATIVDCGSGWYRCTITITPDVDIVMQCAIVIGRTALALYAQYLGDGTHGFYIWGAQLGTGRYVKTTSAVVTTFAQASIDHYDVYLSTELAGTYVKANKRNVNYWKYIISNLRFNSVVYVKVKEISIAGVVGDFSDPARDGECERAVIALTFNGPIGDSIPMGAMFSQMVADGNIVAFRTTASGTIA